MAAHPCLASFKCLESSSRLPLGSTNPVAKREREEGARFAPFVSDTVRDLAAAGTGCVPMFEHVVGRPAPARTWRFFGEPDRRRGHRFGFRRHRDRRRGWSIGSLFGGEQHEEAARTAKMFNEGLRSGDHRHRACGPLCKPQALANGLRVSSAASLFVLKGAQSPRRAEAADDSSLDSQRRLALPSGISRYCRS